MLDKKKILFIGIGACGAKIIDEIRDRDSRYTTLYINTSIKDVEPRKYANLDANVYCIPSADGTGKNRNKAKEYAKDYFVSIIDTIKRYRTHNVIYLVTSCGGGSGSGLTPMIIKMLKKACPDKTVNLVAVKSSLKDSKRAIENTIEFWNDMAVVNEFINAKIYLDNDKGDEDYINKQFARDLDDAISLASGHEKNVIDETDLENVMTAKGGLTILRLNKEFSDNAEFLIQKSIKDSIYIESIEEDCKYLCLSLKDKDFSIKVIENIKNEFEIEEDVFVSENMRDNILILSGTPLPKLMIEMLNEELKERELEAEKRREKREKKEKELKVEIGSNTESEVARLVKKENNNVVDEKTTGASSEIEDLFSDGFFDDLM